MAILVSLVADRQRTRPPVWGEKKRPEAWRLKTPWAREGIPEARARPGLSIYVSAVKTEIPW